MWKYLAALGVGVGACYVLKRLFPGRMETYQHEALLTAMSAMNRRGRSELLNRIYSKPGRTEPIPGSEPPQERVIPPVPAFSPEDKKVILKEVRAYQDRQIEKYGRAWLQLPAEYVTEDELELKPLPLTENAMASIGDVGLSMIARM